MLLVFKNVNEICSFGDDEDVFECVNVWLFGSDMCCNMQGSRCSAAWYGVTSANACRYRQIYMYCIGAVSYKHGLIRKVQ